MQALPLVLVVVLVIVAAAAMVFLRRRRHAATAARLAAASSPVPELSEDDIAWRIGLLDDRPLLLSEFFAGAENEAIEAAEQELGTPILPVLPKAPGAAPVPVTLAAAVGAQPAAPAPVAAAVTMAAVATAPRPVVREPGPSRRYRLWRDSATVVLGAILVVLLVTNLMPGLAVGPSLAGDEDPSSAAVAVVAPTPTSVDASSDVASATPTDAPSGTPVATPTDAPSASPSAGPTPAPTPKPTPKPTPRPTRRPVVRQAPDPTPRRRRDQRPGPRRSPRRSRRPSRRRRRRPMPVHVQPSCVPDGGSTISFTSTSSGTITSYAWIFDDGGATSSNRTRHRLPVRAGNFNVRLKVTGPGGPTPTSTPSPSVPERSLRASPRPDLALASCSRRGLPARRPRRHPGVRRQPRRPTRTRRSRSRSTRRTRARSAVRHSFTTGVACHVVGPSGPDHLRLGGRQKCHSDVIYSPVANYNGTDQFTFTATGPDGPDTRSRRSRSTRSTMRPYAPVTPARATRTPPSRARSCAPTSTATR